MVPSISRKNPFHSSSSHGRGEFSNLAQTRSLHPSHTSYCPQLSGFTPGAVSTAASHFESPFASLGNHPAGYPSSTFQQLPAQAAFLPIASGAPSGTSTPPASLSVPPSHYPGMSPSPFRNPLSDYQLELYSVASVRRDSQPVSGSRGHPGNYVRPPYTVQALHQDVAFIDNLPLNMYPTSRPMRTCKRTSGWHCPLCREPFSRRQDRDRHLSSHLPYCIACSYSDCAWRGYRLDAFRKHRFSEHESGGDVPGEDWSKLYQKLYDPDPLVKKIVQDPTSMGDAEIEAVELVKKQAVALHRRDLLTDPWGHQKKVSRQCPRSSDSETNALPITSSTPTLSSGPPTQLWAPTAPVFPSLTEPYIEAGNGQIFLQHLLSLPPGPSTIPLTNGVNRSPHVTSRYPFF